MLKHPLTKTILIFLPILVWFAPARADTVSGELKQWHRVTITFDGPDTNETAQPNPFRNYRLNVTFTQDDHHVTVPGFYAADGNAAESSADTGDKWRVHFTPDRQGTWNYTASFRTGSDIAMSLDPDTGTTTAFDGAGGTFTIAAGDKSGRDFRGKGLLRYVDKHHLRFAETGEYYLKGGADSPENMLGYFEFDGTYDTSGLIPDFLHRFDPHAGDWNDGDPTWQNGKGKNLIGAMNYLASQEVNSLYFLTYNIDGGDGADTWPWIAHTSRDRFDCSKLDQWEIVFAHMDRLGIQLHVVTQEVENDHALDGGNLGLIRKLYYREMIARFAHHLAVQWNLGEENNNSHAQRKAFADYIHQLDPYDHPVTVHTHYNTAETFYNGIIGHPGFQATSIQGDSDKYNQWAINLRNRTRAAGQSWCIYGDEQGPAVAANLSNLDTLRKNALWGNLMGGGAGVEWYFGYQGNFGDVQSEDFRPAEPLWQDTRHALTFFQEYLPFAEMIPDNSLTADGNAPLVLTLPGEVYVVYLPSGGSAFIKLAAAQYDVRWYDPRNGGDLQTGSVTTLTGPGWQSFGNPPASPASDWAVLITLAGEAEKHTLMVNQGHGDGSYVTGVDIPITADPPPAGQIFDRWTGDTQGIADVAGPETVITMPDQDATLTATYRDPPEGLNVLRFTLINADTDAPITGFNPITDGATINLAALPSRNLNIRADTWPATVGSVRFGYDGNANYQVESVAPYALAGDTNGNYNAWTPSLGQHQLTATPYSSSGASGSAGNLLNIQFNIVDQPVNEPPSVSLTAPADGSEFSAPANILLQAAAFDLDGAIDFVDFFQGEILLHRDTQAPYQFLWSQVPTGQYQLTALADDGRDQTLSPPVTVNVGLSSDFDRDGDVDQSDFGYLQSCLSGIYVPPTPECGLARLDDDGDVDQDDVDYFRHCFRGANIIPDPDCYP